MVSVCPITGGAKFDHLFKGGGPPYLSRVKIYFSPLKLISNLGGDTSRLYEYSVTH